MNKRAWIYGITFLVLGASIIFPLIAQNLFSSRLPVLGQISSFSLTDSQNQTFGSVQLEGKVWVADFIFTTCSGICPVMSRAMANLQRLSEGNTQVHFVSITVNPEVDSPGVFARYAEERKADVRRWHFLTGSREDITRLAVNDFKIGAVEEIAFHSGKFVLIDKHLRIRSYYEGTEQAEVNRLARDMIELSRERK